MAAQDVIAVRARRRGRGPISFLAGALVLVLLASAGAAYALRRRDSQVDAQARRRLAAATFTVSTYGVATDHRVALVLSLQSSVRARVIGAEVTGDGWRAVHDTGVGLVREVDCTGTPPMPLAAAATVELQGQKRSVDLLTDPTLFDVVVRTGREACGDVDARRALSLKASGTIRVPGGLQLALAIANKSAFPVTLRGVSVGRLHLVTNKRLPLVLAPRSTLRVIARIDARGCGAAASVVGLSIEGRGGPAFLTVASADLPQLAQQIRMQRRCR